MSLHLGHKPPHHAQFPTFLRHAIHYPPQPYRW